jgi:hypothetical protein
MVFFNMNICRNNLEDIRLLTEYAREHRLATDYHLNETPMLEQDEHFRHLNENPTYIRPEDWRDVDALVDWLIDKNKSGYQMVNSVPRLQEMKAFMRMSSGLDLRRAGWYGDGAASGVGEEMLAKMPGIVTRPERQPALYGLELPCRPEQCHRAHRWHRGAVFSNVWRDLRLGHYRRTQIRYRAAGRDEADLPEALLLHPESQPGLLL